MGPGRPSWPIPSPPRVLLSPQVFWSLSLSRLHPVGRRYLRDIFEGKDRTENPSLNLYLLCLDPKYLDLILWALSFGPHWRVDVHEWASSHHGLWSFVWALAFVFLCVIAWSWVS